MRYELMFPDEMRRALKENFPLVIPVGVMEYHSEHLVLGVDTLVVARALEIIAEEIPMVLFPPYWLGSASYAVTPPEEKGTLHIPSQTVHKIFSDLFTGLIRVGFKNIHLFVHHQSENFVAGMPTDLAIRLAARETIFTFLEKSRGEGWWGSSDMKNYYNEHTQNEDPFSWISVHPFIDIPTQERFPIDHAGKQETALMSAFCPEGVDMKRFSGKEWFAQSARDSSPEYVKEIKEAILDSLRKRLHKKE
ncbi:MAG: creatininase family protein [Candidatus Ratteibacteria bacterium]|jgi:creatinine amidohydrolase/Fe(II)-dependent formamide hydrolase-like protein